LLDAPDSDSDQKEIDIKKVVHDSSSSSESEEQGCGFEGGEDEMSELDCNDAQVDEKKFTRTVSENNVPQLKLSRRAKTGEINVVFEYSQPSEAYYHTVKALLMQYLDGEEQESLDVMSLADHICERASIG
jgi:hypothetical protein